MRSRRAVRAEIAFISGSPFVLQSVHGLSPFGFGLSFAIASTGYVAGSSLAATAFASRNRAKSWSGLRPFKSRSTRL